jgi:hypothetical protein
MGDGEQVKKCDTEFCHLHERHLNVLLLSSPFFAFSPSRSPFTNGVDVCCDRQSCRPLPRCCPARLLPFWQSMLAGRFDDPAAVIPLV